MNLNSGVELGIKRRGSVAIAPFLPCNGGEGVRRLGACLVRRAAPLPGPLPAHASRGEGEGLCESVARLIWRVKGVYFKLDSGVERGMQRRGSVVIAPSLPCNGGEGGERRRLWARLVRRAAPLPAHASRGEGEGLCESVACFVRRVKGVYFKLDSGVELGMKRRGLVAIAPSLPCNGGEGVRRLGARLVRRAAPLPGPLPAHASRGEGEDLCESVARLVRWVKGVYFKLDSDVERGMQRRGLIAIAPSLPCNGGEGGERRRLGARLVRRAAPLPGPLPAHASRGEGEDLCESVARLVRRKNTVIEGV